VGVTGICNTLNYNNKNNAIDNIICIINGIFHGIYWAWQGRKQQYHAKKIDAGMVSERLNCVCSGSIWKPATPAPIQVAVEDSITSRPDITI
jgi:hypothetical protein